ncbi:cytochrome c-type biogenesis CcmF C-terminal domain-containing protein [Nesterenkonia lutea]|uniref:Cytochrome c-type biogenesis protein CcmF n=1 Tax=Nesterenkonia lutea TaxID=272919 RepID=A0ABR9JBZ7_9MICC|nr:cytochrome c-type biogenesis CcmF C-terminal domain-containing protein [Nesterenkonia lutea]MBE1523454.1 cytochrome c-type biogenesis protein CcmF [Nesterenkonia lutea]
MTGLGTVLLALVLAASLVGAAAWAGILRGSPAGWRPQTLQVAGHWGAVVAFAATSAAVVLVETALLRHDTALNYVAMVAGPELPIYYRVTALWSALEGSLLLWLLILSMVAMVALRPWRSGHPEPTRGHAVTGLVLGLLVAAFAVVALMASPFAVPEAAITARPSPLLQDHVAMGIHPPLLYGGFLALAVPYALALSGLVCGEMDARWADRLHRWTLVSWMLMTAGIVLGGWWSYAVLGWGGYWAWDPVENASLLPWLTATALLHTVAPRARTGSWRIWAAALAGASFVLVLLATFITRSGVVESIHAFTTSSLGPTLLVIVLLASAAWLVPLHRRRRSLAEVSTSPLLSRPNLLRLNRTLLVLIMLVVLVGTLLPTVLEAVTGERLSVGPPWYHRTLAPLALVLLVAMALGPWVPLRGTSWAALGRRAFLPLLAGALVLGVVALLFTDVWLAVGAGIAGFAAASLLAVGGTRRGRDRHAVGAWVAHTGMAIAAVAVLGGGLGTVSQETVPVGGTVTAGTTTATVLGLEGEEEGRRSVARATVALGEGRDFLSTVEPELRWYETERTMLAAPEIRTEPLRDVYVTLLDLDEEEGLVTLRLAVTPLVGWIWSSAALMILGALIAGWPRRRRSSAHRRSGPAPETSEVRIVSQGTR